MEGSYVVPTIVGLPLSFEVNGSAVVSLHLQGKVSAKNLLFGPKSLTLKGSVIPRYVSDDSCACCKNNRYIRLKKERSQLSE